MISRFDLENQLDRRLAKYTPSMLDQLYLRVFNTDDGLMVLQDIANRSFVDITTNTEKEEGVRCAYLNIMARMRNAVTKGRK